MVRVHSGEGPLRVLLAAAVNGASEWPSAVEIVNLDEDGHRLERQPHWGTRTGTTG
jgi:hypothetical protein